MQTNRRLIVTGPKQAEIVDADMPDCPDDGVVVRAIVTAVSTGTELRVYRAIPVDEAGRFLHEIIPFQLPCENGYSMVGEIVEVGSSSDLQKGQRVFARASHRAFAASPTSRITPIPAHIPDDEATFLSVLEVAHTALRQGAPPVGGNVAIVGQGVIGLSILAYASAFGLRTVVVDPDESRLEIARTMGATLAISPKNADAIDRALEVFDGEGADAAFEATSRWDGVRTAMELARTDGRVVIVSRHTRTPEFNPAGHPFLGKRLQLVTTYGYPADGHRWDYARSVGLTVNLLSRGLLNIRPMITHRFDSSELPDVYRRLDAGESDIVGAVIDWSR